MPSPSVIIIGAGPSGIAMGHQIKQVIGSSNFTIYEQSDRPGGVWHLNTYPSCGCDVYSHLYSFSFNLNPEWTQELANQPEIERYMNDTIDKLELRPHIHCEVSCIGASWNSSKQRWVVRLKDLKTGQSFQREADALISCVGAISVPKDCNIPGHETFTGTLWHSARWNHTFDYSDKRVAVVGNGCSAAQFTPRLVESGAEVVQFARSPQWYHPRPNHKFSALQRFLLRNVPGLIKLYRLYLFVDTDNLLTTYLAGPHAEKVRARVEKESKAYMESVAPAKYHRELLPAYPLGCKRRVFDPGYLACLNEPNMELVSEGIARIEGNTIYSSSGKSREVDAIVLATGYKVQEFLTPLEIHGDDGKALSQYWKESRGAQAYKGTFVSHFPNFAVIFGPNSFPAHNSVIYTAEVQAEFTRKALLAPLFSGRATKVSVRQAAEDHDAAAVQLGLKNMVWEAGCSNWYLNEWGRNTASYPGYASSYWRETFFPNFDDFILEGGTAWWPLYAATSFLSRHRGKIVVISGTLAVAAAAGFKTWRK